ncbi:MAG: N-acetylmuramoyl-L-alanine amidase [Halanaerobiaceae bacterium]
MKSEYIVIIDPGHGSIDKGTHYKDIYEKDINLQIAKKLKKELTGTNIKPILTRTEDKLYNDSRNDDIKYRPSVVKKHNADFLISIHANNFPTSQPSGSQVFYKPASPKSKQLADTIHKELIKIRKVNNRPLLPGQYYILQQVDCPAILIETGFLSNPEDRNKLTDTNYQKKIVSGIKKGLINYIESSVHNVSGPISDNISSSIEESKNNTDIKLYYIKPYKNKNVIVADEFTYPVIDNLNKYVGSKKGEILVKSIINQLKTAPGEMISPIPAQTTVKSIKIREDKVQINFSREYIDNFNWGAEMEQLSLEALRKSIFSLPEINKIEILIEGKTRKTLGGHMQINSPISRKHVPR